uniref:60S ribosomal protein L29 n=1 Tax=Globodera pallida TaxID=36090 RepID=A0A183C8Z7_GLOPA
MHSNDAQDLLGGGSQPSKRNHQHSLATMKLTNVDKKKRVSTNVHPKRPVGMHRELYNLFVHQGKDNNKGN